MVCIVFFLLKLLRGEVLPYDQETNYERRHLHLHQKYLSDLE